MRSFGVMVTVLLFAAPGYAAQKPTIVIKPAPADDGRPTAVAITVGPQGSDYAIRIDYDQAPWGDGCKTRCANTTVLLDTDNSKATGLKLETANAPETGADLAITILGTREYREDSSGSTLKVKVTQFGEAAAALEQGTLLADLDVRSDGERLNATDKSVFVLIDANVGDLPSGPKLRAIYHPLGTKPLVGLTTGLNSPSSNRVEIFEKGHLTNPPPKKKPTGESH